jgi:hypothetical protein
MKTLNILLLTTITLLFGIFTTSCSKKDGCTDPLANNYNADADKDDGSCTYDDPAPVPVTHSNITFTFTHNFGGTPVSASTFNQFNYVNANDDTLSLSKLRYLISDVRLYKANGDSIVIDGYNLVDVTNSAGMSYVTATNIPHDTYTGVSFIFGFDSVDNLGNYLDLNATNWNWPSGLGGGYHFMQMEGMYKELGYDSLYAYHQGTAKVSTGVYELNHFKADLAGVTLSKLHVNVEVKMDIAEWYQNPNLWDLNVYHSTLMPNYTAQKMMQANGATVFSLGTVTQTD